MIKIKIIVFYTTYMVIKLGLLQTKIASFVVAYSSIQETIGLLGWLLVFVYWKINVLERKSLWKNMKIGDQMNW